MNSSSAPVCSVGSLLSVNDLNRYQQSTSENVSSVRVNLGLDADVKMILEMDPTIVNIGFDNINDVCNGKISGLPPKTGG